MLRPYGERCFRSFLLMFIGLLLLPIIAFAQTDTGRIVSTLR